MRHIGSITIIEHLNPYRKYIVKETVHLFNCDFILQSTSTPKDNLGFIKNIATNASNGVVILGWWY